MTVAVSNDIAKFNQRMPVPNRLKAQFAQILEPGLVEKMLRCLVVVAAFVDEFELARHDEPHALLYAA